jgi:hypothetical protein
MIPIWRWFGKDLESISDDRTTSIKEFILDTLLLLGTRKKWSIASTRGPHSASQLEDDAPPQARSTFVVFSYLKKSTMQKKISRHIKLAIYV